MARTVNTTSNRSEVKANLFKVFKDTEKPRYHPVMNYVLRLSA
jgi:hypothetical protein